MKNKMSDYLEGKTLFGDDFSIEQIKQWFEEESEGYANLGNKNIETYSYGYHMINKIHGFDKIKDVTFNNVLGIGSAWGYEFETIIRKIKNLVILEPSDNMLSIKIGELIPIYIKPNINGSLPMNDNSFDLITCFGTLHHIPNVSFVLQEMIRVLKPNGYLLIREPIISMGDWRKPRKNLTKNEREIPVSFFDSEFNRDSIEIVSKEYCFTVTSLFQRTIGKMFKNPIHSYRFYVLIDKYLSYLLKKNVHYHATKKIHKIAPQSIFYVIKKITDNNIN